MNIYKAYYKNQSKEIQADTSYQAQQKAAKEFKAKHAHEVTVILVAKSDVPVIQLPLF